MPERPEPAADIALDPDTARDPNADYYDLDDPTDHFDDWSVTYDPSDYDYDAYGVRTSAVLGSAIREVVHRTGISYAAVERAADAYVASHPAETLESKPLFAVPQATLAAHLAAQWAAFEAATEDLCAMSTAYDVDTSDTADGWSA